MSGQNESEPQPLPTDPRYKPPTLWDRAAGVLVALTMGCGGKKGECAGGPRTPDWCDLFGEKLNVTRWTVE